MNKGVGNTEKDIYSKTGTLCVSHPLLYRQTSKHNSPGDHEGLQPPIYLDVWSMLSYFSSDY